MSREIKDIGHHTIEKILRNEPVRHKTLAKIVKQIQQTNVSEPNVNE